jgi:LysR family cys regulon transcriptional activator
MRLEQLRALREIVRHGFSVSRAAQALNAPQPGVSRQLRALERELGIDIFARRHKRLLGLTAPGAAVLEVARRMLEDAENLGKIAQDFSAEDSGNLAVATTHTQARYALPAVIKRFAARYPRVRLTVRQDTPAGVVELVRTGAADLCIGSEGASAADPAALVFFPCYDLQRVVLTPRGHPLLRERRLTLEALARHPIITYDAPFIGRSRLVRAFAGRGLRPDIVLSASDTDVIKTCVELGLGVAIVASLAFDPARDRGLRALDASPLIEPNTIYLGVRRHDYLRGYVYAFIELFAPHLAREKVAEAIQAPAHHRAPAPRRRPPS